MAEEEEQNNQNVSIPGNSESRIRSRSLRARMFPKRGSGRTIVGELP